jgi:hypothetical protein
LNAKYLLAFCPVTGALRRPEYSEVFYFRPIRAL